MIDKFELKNQEWESRPSKLIEGEQYVAALDIMGFKKMTESIDLKDLKQKFDQLIASVFETTSDAEFIIKEKSKENSCINPIIYSDTILLVSESCNSDCLQALLIATEGILYSSFKQNIPLRGVILKDHIKIDLKRQLFSGRSIPRLNRLERFLKSFGVVLDQKIVDDINHNFSEIKDLYSPIETETENGPMELSLISLVRGFAHIELGLVHSDTALFELMGGIESHEKELLETVELMCQDRPKQYGENTIKYVKHQIELLKSL